MNQHTGGNVSKVKQVEDLQIEQDLRWEKTEWSLEKIGWVFLAAIVLAAMLGLLGGDGPLNKSVARDPTGVLVVEYQPLGRWRGSADMRLHIFHRVPADTIVRIALDRTLAEAISLEHSKPEPFDHSVNGDEVQYAFKTIGSADSVLIQLETRRTKAGIISGGIRVVDGPSVNVKWFVYP